RPFESIDELVEQSEYPWSFAKGALPQNYFEGSYLNDPTSTGGRMWSGKSKLITSPYAVLPMIHEKNAMVIDYMTTIFYLGYDFKQSGECRVSWSKQNLLPVHYHFVFTKTPKGRELKERFDI
ncbi:unnamed protein product, partial [Meganyctiphanes norvegica]